MSFNPIKLEIFKNAVCSVADEMVLTMVRIAFSPILKDTMDLSSAICDDRGQLIAQGLSLPLHLGSIPDAMAAVLAKHPEGLDPEDVVVLNDPYVGGGMHLPDIFMFKPIFFEQRRLGYAVVVAHHNDMGGRVPGSSAADSTEIFQEGLRIPILKLYEGGRPNETLLAMIALNVRTPHVIIGDIQAQLAGCRIGERGVAALAARYGPDEVAQYFDALLDYSERGARRTIESVPDGTYGFTDYLDDDGVNLNVPVPVVVSVKVAGDELTVNFEGTSPQVRGAINSTLSFTKSSVYFAIRSIMGADVPNNAGFFRPIHLETVPGTLVHAVAPAACAARGVTGFRVIDAIFGALGKAVPDRIRAAGEGGTTSYSFGGQDEAGRFFLFREAIMGNWGGADRADGLDGLANPAANVSNSPIEVTENGSPIRVERYELVADSGGAGRRRGGMAVMRQLRFLGQRATLQLRSDRRDHQPYGLDGGGSGSGSQTLISDAAGWNLQPTKITVPIVQGQVVRHTTAGAGGFGDPLDRDPALVLDDVRNGKVTVEAAAASYGVCLTGPPWVLDAAATEELRRSRRSKAPVHV